IERAPFGVTIVQLAAKPDPVSMVQRKQLLCADDRSLIQGSKERRSVNARAEAVKKLFLRSRAVEVSRVTETVVGWLPLCDHLVMPKAAHDERELSAERFDVLSL